MFSSPYYDELHHINPDYTNQPKGQFYPLTHWAHHLLRLQAKLKALPETTLPRTDGMPVFAWNPGNGVIWLVDHWIMQLPESSNGYGSRHWGTNGPWWTCKTVVVLHLNPSVLMRLMILHHIISKCLTAALVSCFFWLFVQEWNWTCVWWSGLDIGHPGRHNMFPDSFNLEVIFGKSSIIMINMNFTCAVGIWLHDSLLTFAEASGETEDICLIGVGDDGHFGSLYPGRQDRFEVWAVSWPCWPRAFYDPSLFGIYSHGFHHEWQIIVRKNNRICVGMFLGICCWKEFDLSSCHGNPCDTAGNYW